MNSQTLIGIAQMKISREPTEILIAPNLGSCLGLAVFDPSTKIGGMIHCLLPLSKSDPEKAAANPFMYVDTGVTKMLEQMFNLGVNKKMLHIAVAGCGNINDQNNVFEIGKKNITILKKILWKNNLLLKGEHTGDALSRTISLNVATGKTTVKVNGQIIELM